ncbi:hypothetical protein [Flavobacterium sp. H122]|uniref:hypothetical protein n=1 Tax=Flavobacterium sp. H122 TaxID=2529860 RepID=UPI0010A9E706|nr:hypothetical protein [Flavobacterium sp. H122]
MLKWARKYENGKINELPGIASTNQLSKDGKIMIGITINIDSSNVKIYAYFRKTSENVSVEIKMVEIFHPYIIPKSVHRKGVIVSLGSRMKKNSE